MIGAIVPSSPQLGAVLARGIAPQRPMTVVEIGPGTGAVSQMIQRAMAPGGQHIAVELDPRLAQYLRRALPQLTVVEGDAADLNALLAPLSITHADAVVCSLPWTLFPETQQRAILGAIRDLLTPSGSFTTFAYRHAMWMAGARRFRALLNDYFSAVATSRPVWRNIPPAHVYLCRQPRH